VKFLKPPQVILLSYLVTITVGTFLLLSLPLTYREVSFTDALFTVTSAVTVTGLTVIETSSDFNLGGKIFILILIQIGGLGYMTLASFFLLAMGKRINLREQLVLSESLNYPNLHSLMSFLKKVVVFAFVSELIGSVLLTIVFIEDFPLEKAILFGVFHSISAFNNAGFTLFEDNFGVMANIIMASLVILGGLGFVVINELFLYFRHRVRKLSLHTKIVLFTSLSLTVLGVLSLCMTEPKAEIFNCFFLSVYSRTAGFSPVDVGTLSESSLFLLMILMFIGASPGGTGGGIKTTTFAVIVIAVYSYIRGSEAQIFRRRISNDQIYKAMVILSLSVAFVSIVNLLLDRLEEKDFLKTLFEVISAFSTVGLSTGSEKTLSFSALLSSEGKLLIVLSMIAGRVGILSFAVALMGRKKKTSIRYPEERILL